MFQNVLYLYMQSVRFQAGKDVSTIFAVIVGACHYTAFASMHYTLQG